MAEVIIKSDVSTGDTIMVGLDTLKENIQIEISKVKIPEKES